MAGLSRPLDIDSKWLARTPKYTRLPAAQQTRFWHLKSLPGKGSIQKAESDATHDQLAILEANWRTLSQIGSDVATIVDDYEDTTSRLDKERTKELLSGEANDDNDGSLGVLEHSKGKVQELITKHTEKCIHLNNSVAHIMSWFDLLMEEKSNLEEALQLHGVEALYSKSYDGGSEFEAEVTHKMQEAEARLRENHAAFAELLDALRITSLDGKGSLRALLTNVKQLTEDLDRAKEKEGVLLGEIKELTRQLKAAEERSVILERRLKARAVLESEARSKREEELRNVKEQLHSGMLEQQKKDVELRTQLASMAQANSDSNNKSGAVNLEVQAMRSLLRKQEKSMEKDRIKYENDLRSLRADLASREKAESKFRSKLQYELEDKKSKQIRRIQTDFVTELGKTKKSHTRDIKTLIRDHQDKIDEESKKLQKALYGRDEDMAGLFASIRSEYEQKILLVEEKNKQDQLELTKDSVRRREAMVEDHKRALANAEVRLAAQHAQVMQDVQYQAERDAAAFNVKLTELTGSVHQRDVEVQSLKREMEVLESLLDNPSALSAQTATPPVEGAPVAQSPEESSVVPSENDGGPNHEQRYLDQLHQLRTDLAGGKTAHVNVAELRAIYENKIQAVRDGYEARIKDITEMASRQAALDLGRVRQLEQQQVEMAQQRDAAGPLSSTSAAERQGGTPIEHRRLTSADMVEHPQLSSMSTPNLPSQGFDGASLARHLSAIGDEDGLAARVHTAPQAGYAGRGRPRRRVRVVDESGVHSIMDEPDAATTNEESGAAESTVSGGGRARSTSSTGEPGSGRNLMQPILTVFNEPAPSTPVEIAELEELLEITVSELKQSKGDVELLVDQVQNVGSREADVLQGNLERVQYELRQLAAQLQAMRAELASSKGENRVLEDKLLQTLESLSSMTQELQDAKRRLTGADSADEADDDEGSDNPAEDDASSNGDVDGAVSSQQRASIAPVGGDDMMSSMPISTPRRHPGPTPLSHARDRQRGSDYGNRPLPPRARVGDLHGGVRRGPRARAPRPQTAPTPSQQRVQVGGHTFRLDVSTPPERNDENATAGQWRQPEAPPPAAPMSQRQARPVTAPQMMYSMGSHAQPVPLREALGNIIESLTDMRRNLHRQRFQQTSRRLLDTDTRLKAAQARITMAKMHTGLVLKDLQHELATAEAGSPDQKPTGRIMTALRRMELRHQIALLRWEERKKQILAERHNNYQRSLAAMRLYAFEDHILVTKMASTRLRMQPLGHYMHHNLYSYGTRTVQFGLPSFIIRPLDPRPQAGVPAIWSSPNPKALMRPVSAPGRRFIDSGTATMPPPRPRTPPSEKP